jgi:Holliday junction resolvase
MNRPPINSRLKGAGAERELAGLIHAHLGVRLVRKLDQSRGGGFDLELAPAGQTGPVAETLAGLAIECKRHQAITPAMLAGFWGQAVRQADAAGLVPCLAWRANRHPWYVTVPLSWLIPGTAGHPDDLAYTATLPLDAFCLAARERPHHES